jgi:hypothetical protein
MIALGSFNKAFVPIPFTLPEEVEPRMVETARVDKMIIRIILFVFSAIRAKSPSEEIATPVGSENFALVPIPFEVPDEVWPASVETRAVETTIFRNKLFFESGTRTKIPSGENPAPVGLLNDAAVPTPFVEPDPWPAKELTEIVEIIILRI